MDLTALAQEWLTYGAIMVISYIVGKKIYQAIKEKPKREEKEDKN